MTFKSSLYSFSKSLINGNSAIHELHQVAQTLIKTAFFPFSNAAASRIS